MLDPWPYKQSNSSQQEILLLVTYVMAPKFSHANGASSFFAKPRFSNNGTSQTIPKRSKRSNRVQFDVHGQAKTATTLITLLSIHTRAR